MTSDSTSGDRALAAGVTRRTGHARVDSRAGGEQVHAPGQARVPGAEEAPPTAAPSRGPVPSR